MKKTAAFITRTIAVVATIFLASCGGSGGGSSSSPAASTAPAPTLTLSGVAAVGTPIVSGSVNVVCATGGTNTPATTDNAGAWTITLSGQTAPCAVKVTGGTIGGAANTTPYHSIAISSGTVNVTPLTDLVIANLTGAATPSTWFGVLGSSTTLLSGITQAQVDTAFTNLKNALSGIVALGNNNPITTKFTPTSGDVNDDMLTALANGITSSNTTHAKLLSTAAAAALNAFAAPTGLNTALSTAYSNTTSGKIPFTIGGTVTGLTGAGFGIQNGSEKLLISADGAFTFKNTMTTGTLYRIMVSSQPKGQTCQFSGATGTVNSANVTNISIKCVDVTLTCTKGGGGGTGGIQLYDPDGYYSYLLSTYSPNSPVNVTVDWGAKYTGAAGSYTGSLSATLWAVSSSFSGGNIYGVELGTFPPNFTGTGAYSSTQISAGGYSINTIKSKTTDTNPPAGQYCLVLTLQEYLPNQCNPNPNGYCMVDWFQFSSTAIFQ